jgi:hypothetical protein
MNELNLVRDLGRDVPLPTTDQLAPARARLLAELETGRPRRRRRFAVAAAITATVAAGVTALAMITSTTPRGAAPPPAAAAADVLTRAAAAARAQPDVAPRPDQFVYAETRVGSGVRRAWLSADGKHDGLVQQQGENLPLPACRSGRATVVKGDQPVGETEACEPWPAYRPDLPTTKEAMLAYLRTDAKGTNQLAKTVLALSNESYVRPASRGALFEAVSAIPGIKAVPDAVDGAGRHGVGVWWTSEGSTGGVTLVFDRETYRYLGTNFDALMVLGVVDRVGQRP